VDHAAEGLIDGCPYDCGNLTLPDLTSLTARTVARRLLCGIPPLRKWFEEIDQLATDARMWHGAKTSSVSGSAADQAAILSLLSLLTPRQATNIRKIRLGRDGDGGYVLLDDFANVSSALSFGINTDCSWDLTIAERGIDVYQYDHTVDGPPVANPRFQFFKKMIADQESEISDTVGSALAKIEPISGKHLILKIDIEGSEWEVLDAATPDELSHFSQIVGEFHGFSQAADALWRERVKRVLTKLRSMFDVVHVHANNCGPFNIIANVPVAEALEVTFANRTIYTCHETNEVFPTELDQPNTAGRPDIFLGNLRVK
jgi:hypothetical protein